MSAHKKYFFFKKNQSQNLLQQELTKETSLQKEESQTKEQAHWIRAITEIINVQDFLHNWNSKIALRHLQKQTLSVQEIN